MRAVHIANKGVTVKETETPAYGPTSVLISVSSAGLNGADLLQVRGSYPPPLGYRPDIPGLEFAGRVVAVGDQVHRWSIGDAVMGITGGAAQAEYVVAEEATLLEVPDIVPLNIAGGFPETFFTAYDALFSQAHLSMGERLCVHGGAGGVGLAAIQLGKATGATVTATVRNPSVASFIESLGARCIAPGEFVGSGPYDVILELVGAANLTANLSELETRGRIAVIGVGAGAKAEIDLRMVMGKRATLYGSTLRARPLHEKAEVTSAIQRHVVPLLASKQINVITHELYPLDQVELAYRSFEQGGKLGKIILTFD